MSEDTISESPRPDLRVEVLGHLRVQRDGAELNLRGPRPSLLLAVLVAADGVSVSFDRLLDDLYGDEPPPTARKSVQVHVSNLRRELGSDGPLLTTPNGYRFDTAHVEIDATAFDDEMRAAAALVETDPGEASSRMATALARWRGAPYVDFEGHPALQSEVIRLNEVRLRGLELRIGADLRLGRHADVLGELETLSTDHPYREELRALQMLALYRSGRQADALRVYGRTRELLIEELGIEPSVALRELEEQILQQSAALELAELPHRQRLAFLVTDIEGSTALWEHDPEAMGRALTRHDQIIDESVGTHGGEVFKHTGDGVLAVFPSISTAAAAGVDIQVTIAGEPWEWDRPLRVRMAVDDGPVERRGDDYFGPVLNRVMRVMSAGHGGQLLVSEYGLGGLGQPVRPLGEFDLKGVGRLGVHQVVTGGLAADFPELRTDRTPAALMRSGFAQTIRGYELREELGTGAFGIVYRAYQASVGREVAVKVIRPDFANQPEFVKGFEAEAQFVAQLEHPHIVSLYDYWRDPEGAYLVMNYLRGGSLAQALERGTWNPPATLRLVDQIGTALAYAHRNGITHRDIKPGNVLLDDDGNAYLSDFGIAAQSLGPIGDPQHTSVAYLAPEQLVGAPVDARSDLYSLAMLTYEMLTGHRPELGGRPRSVREVRHDLPAELDVVLGRATIAAPDQRYDRVEDFMRGLRQAFGADVSASSEPIVDVDIRNPYKGLRAFTEVDAGDFFGRDAVVEQLIERLRTSGLTAAVGPSGCGKSSVVKAGLLPAVRSGALGADIDCVIAEMFPGTYPFEELEACLIRVAVDRPDGLLSDLEHDERGLLRVSKRILPDDNTSMLLVIDQFEELFSLVSDESVRERFLDSLVTVARDDRSRVKVLVTMRADFFDRPLQYSEFGEVLKQGLVPIAMPTSDNLALAISQPARSVGLELEPGLVTAVLGDVADEPGGLPLMQYAMTELVDRREGRVLTLDAYHSTGGAAGALTRRAEDLYTGLSASGQAATRDLFLRLVAVSDDSDDTRRRVRLSELSSMDVDRGALDTAIEEYGTFRLLSFDRDPVTRGPTVEVAHEALIREWPRYRGWIDDERDDLLLERRLEAAARDWNDGERDPSFLLRGGRLEQYRDWMAETGLRITDAEQEYLDASVEQGDREESIERGRVRRLRALLAVVGVVAVVAVVAGLLALRSRDEVGDARDEADLRRLVAESANLVDSDRRLASLVALEAYRVEPAPETLGAIQRALVNAPTNWLGSLSGVAPYSGAEFLDERTLVAASGAGLDVWDLVSGNVVRTVDIGAEPTRLAVSEDRRRLAIGYQGGSWEVLDTGTFEVMTRGSLASPVNAIALSEDGSHLAVGGRNGEVTVSNLEDGAVHRIDRPQTIVDLAFHPDGTMLAVATGRFGGTAAVFDPDTGEQSGIDMMAPDGGAQVVAWHDLGLLVVSGQSAATFDPLTGTAVADHLQTNGDYGAVGQGATADSTVVLMSDDVTIEVLTADGDEFEVIGADPQIGDPQGLAVDPSGSVVAAVGIAGVSLISTEGRGTLALRTLSTDGLMLELTEDGSVAMTGLPSPVTVWKLDEPTAPPEVLDRYFKAINRAATFHLIGDEMRALWDEGIVVPVTAGSVDSSWNYALSPDGETLVYDASPQGSAGLVTVIDRSSDEVIVELDALHRDDDIDGNQHFAADIEFSPDGSRLVITSFVGGVHVYDTETWTPARESLRPGSGFMGIAFTSDGSKALTFDSTRREVELRDGLTFEIIDGPELATETFALGGQSPDITADDRYAVLGGGPSGGRIWDLESLTPVGDMFPSIHRPFQVSLASEAKLLGTVTENGAVIWNVDVDAWPEIACKAAGRNMTQTEWDQFGPQGQPYHATCSQYPAGQ